MSGWVDFFEKLNYQAYKLGNTVTLYKDHIKMATVSESDERISIELYEADKTFNRHITLMLNNGFMDTKPGSIEYEKRSDKAREDSVKEYGTGVMERLREAMDSDIRHVF